VPRPKSAGLPKEQVEALRVDALLDVAAQVFLEHGFQAASTTEIARRAKASKQTFYARFPSKDALFIAVIGRRMARMTELFGAFLDERQPLKKVLLNMAHHFYDVLLREENVALMRIVYMEAPRLPEIARAFMNAGPERGTARLAQFLASQMRAGALKSADPRLAAEHFVALVHGQSMQRALLDLAQPMSKKKLDARIAKTVELFLTAYARRR
jgi:AcrR family transcriptional regulator